MTRKEEPKITKNSRNDDYTCIRFRPDLKLFGMKELDDDIVGLFTKRAYDMAGCTAKKVGVTLNGKRLEIKNFS
jgi:DNA topoisomerase II